MNGALISVSVLGLLCAANPWGIMIAVLLLQARRAGVVWAYVLAWVGSLSVGLFVLVAGFGALVETGSGGASTLSAVISLVLGVALAGWGLQRVANAPSGDRSEPAPPGWLRAIENISYIPAFLLGIYSATWPMVIAAAGEIVQVDASTAAAVGLCVLFVVLGSSTVVAVAAIGTFSARSAEMLDRLRAWLTLHSRAVITAILLSVGALLVARGLTGLL